MIIFSLDLKEKKRETEKSAKEKIAWLPCVMQFSVVTLDCVELFSYFMVIADVDIFESIGYCDRPLQL